MKRPNHPGTISDFIIQVSNKTCCSSDQMVKIPSIIERILFHVIIGLPFKHRNNPSIPETENEIEDL
jgi:hypothetical protein